MRLISLLAVLLLTMNLSAQTEGLWTDHLPYNSVNDIAINGDVFYCAANQGLFVYNDREKEIFTYSKLNGLNDIGITSLAYNKKHKTLIVGYKSANLDLISGDNIINMGAIKRASGYTGKKRINHVITKEDKAWMATGFGIVEIDLVNLVVNGTYIIGPNASEIEVYKLAIDEQNNRMYAATPDGLYSANMNDPLIFFQFWQKDTTLAAGDINQVAALKGNIFANKVTQGSVEDSVFYNDGTGWKYLEGQGINKKLDMRSVNDFLVIVNPYSSNFLTSDLTLKYNISNAFYEPNSYFPRCAYIKPDGETMLIGNDGTGLIISRKVSTNERIIPNGPNSSQVFRLTAHNKRVYVATGAIDELWTRAYVNAGIYKLDDFDWEWIKPDSIDNIGDIVNILVDPRDASTIYAAAWGTGILEMKNDQLLTVWDNQTTNGMLQGPPGDEQNPRSGGMAIDKDRNLWVTSSLSQRLLSVRRADGTWESFSGGSFSGTNVFDIVINQLNQKWIRTRKDGLIVMEDNNNQPRWKRISTGPGNGDLPSNTILDFAEDLDGEMWIGTSEGLVVLYSPNNIFSTTGRSFDAQPILFEEDGVVQRLLGTEAVSAVAVDGSNKKWFGTLNSGVFYTSDDGTETIHHFTAENSPLLSNAVIDISIDGETGQVYFATAEGVVSYRGSATRGYNEYTNVYAYPNPVRPGYVGPIYIRGLVTNARVKITDVAGSIVYETVAEGGQASWDGKNLNGEDVVTGVYMAYITDDLGERTTVTKILIVR